MAEVDEPTEEEMKALWLEELNKVTLPTGRSYPTDDDLVYLLHTCLVSHESDRTDDHYIALCCLKLLKEKLSA